MYQHHIFRATTAATANTITNNTTTKNNTGATATVDNNDPLQFVYLTSLKKICSGKLE